MDLSIYTPGDPQTLAGALRAVVMTLGTSGGFSGSMLADMVKLGMIGAVLMALFSALRNRGFPRFDHLMAYFIATVVLMTPTATVTVESSYDGNNTLMRNSYAPQVVDDVPIVVALPLSLGTSAGRIIGERMTAAMAPAWTRELCNIGADRPEMRDASRCSVVSAFKAATRGVIDFITRTSQDPRDHFAYNVSMFFRFCDQSGKIAGQEAFWRSPGYDLFARACPPSGQPTLDNPGLVVLTQTATSKVASSGAITDAQSRTCLQLCGEIRDKLKAGASAEAQLLQEFNCADGSGSGCGTMLRSSMDALLVNVSGAARATWNDIVSSAAFACFLGSSVNRSAEAAILARTTAGAPTADADVCNAVGEQIRSALINAEKAIAEADARAANWIVMATVIMPFMVGAMLFTGYGNLGRVFAAVGGYLAFLAVPDVVNVTGEMIVAGQADRFMQMLQDAQSGALQISGSCNGSGPCAHDLFAYFREIANAINAYADTAKNGAWGLIAIAASIGLLGIGGAASAGGGTAAPASGGGVATDLQGYTQATSAALGRGVSADAARAAAERGTAMLSGAGDFFSGLERSIAATAAGSIQGFMQRTAASSAMGLTSSATAGQTAATGVGFSRTAGLGTSTSTGARQAIQQAMDVLQRWGTGETGAQERRSAGGTRNASTWGEERGEEAYSGEDMRAAAQVAKELAGRFTAGGRFDSASFLSALTSRAAAVGGGVGRALGALGRALSAGGGLSADVVQRIADSLQSAASQGERTSQRTTAGARGERFGEATRGASHSRTAEAQRSTSAADTLTAARELLAQELARVDDAAQRTGGVQDQSALQFAASFTPMTFSPQGMAADMLVDLARNGGDMRAVITDRLARGGFDADQIQRALSAYDARYAQGSRASFNRFGTMFESASLAMADIGASRDPADRALATQGLMALSGHYDQARAFATQARGLFGEHEQRRRGVEDEAAGIDAQARERLQQQQAAAAEAVANLPTREQVMAAHERIASEAQAALQQARRDASFNPLSYAQAYADYQKQAQALGIEPPKRLTPEQLAAWAHQTRKALAAQSDLNPALKALENMSPSQLMAASTLGTLAVGLGQAGLETLLQRAAQTVASPAARAAAATALRQAGTWVARGAAAAAGVLGGGVLATGASVAVLAGTAVDAVVMAATGRSALGALLSGGPDAAKAVLQEAWGKITGGEPTPPRGGSGQPLPGAGRGESTTPAPRAGGGEIPAAAAVQPAQPPVAVAQADPVQQQPAQPVAVADPVQPPAQQPAPAGAPLRVAQAPVADPVQPAQPVAQVHSFGIIDRPASAAPVAGGGGAGADAAPVRVPDALAAAAGGAPVAQQPQVSPLGAGGAPTAPVAVAQTEAVQPTEVSPVRVPAALRGGGLA